MGFVTRSFGRGRQETSIRTGAPSERDCNEYEVVFGIPVRYRFLGVCVFDWVEYYAEFVEDILPGGVRSLL